MVGALGQFNYYRNYQRSAPLLFQSDSILKSLRWVALGGVLGSLLRWGLSLAFNQTRAGTLVANLIGVGLACLSLVYVEKNKSIELRHFLLPGFCGGLTTFSSVALQSAHSQGGGFIYLVETLLLSLGIAAIMIPLSQKIFKVQP